MPCKLRSISWPRNFMPTVDRVSDPLQRTGTASGLRHERNAGGATIVVTAIRLERQQ